MEALLNRWLEGTDAVLTLDEASISQARERVRAVGREQGLAGPEVERLAIVVSELGHNQLAHAHGGAIAVLPVSRGGVAGVEVIAADRGKGIADPVAALRGPGSVTGSLGQGLAGVVRQADEVDFDVRWGEGTCVRARKYVTPPSYRAEVGVIGRAYPGEPVSGDHALWQWGDNELVVGVVDGLGHGVDAHEAADRTIELLRAQPLLSPELLLQRCDAGLKGTRGAALAVARLQRGSGALVHACVGNIATLLCRPGQVEALACTPGVLGIAQPRLRIRRSEASLRPGELLVMHSDGLNTRTTVEDAVLLRRHPLEVAYELMTRFGKNHDDALVLVARSG
ncbi:SpoIIE family protein phosphatase [Hyalangium gracile]|uniref:SpoIIE family protein phosphatase n=1 Tax=Hyalangium gracile TaxID=394092 RepID=UPI001CC90DA9|nr:SpoIIE family protein phosphatase [Hyalangium gracile]